MRAKRQYRAYGGPADGRRLESWAGIPSDVIMVQPNPIFEWSADPAPVVDLPTPTTYRVHRVHVLYPHPCVRSCSIVRFWYLYVASTISAKHLDVPGEVFSDPPDKIEHYAHPHDEHVVWWWGPVPGRSLINVDDNGAVIVAPLTVYQDRDPWVTVYYFGRRLPNGQPNLS